MCDFKITSIRCASIPGVHCWIAKMRTQKLRHFMPRSEIHWSIKVTQGITPPVTRCPYGTATGTLCFHTGAPSSCRYDRHLELPALSGLNDILIYGRVFLFQQFGVSTSCCFVTKSMRSLSLVVLSTPCSCAFINSAIRTLCAAISFS